ncbi:MAG: hypothetical protein AAGL98_03950, partial [Planctomycetota bacterium]
MNLLTVPFEPPAAELPPASAALLADAAERIADYLNAGRGQGPAAFVPADFPRVYTGLAAVYETGLVPGDRFCEWGSGFGVVAGLATQVGFEACGIEIERDLVEQAEALVTD